MTFTDDELLANRLRRALSRAGAFIEAKGADYVLRTSSDRRRPAALLFEEPIFRLLADEPGLKDRADGGWGLARAWTEPTPVAVGRPGVIEGDLQVVIEGVRQSRRANLAGSAISWLARRQDATGRPWLTPSQLAAAERLREDHRLSGVIGRLTMDWSFAPRAATPGLGRVDPAERGLAAKMRVKRALAAMSAHQALVLDRLCLRELSLLEVEREFRLGARAARPLLQDALTCLARHYGLN